MSTVRACALLSMSLVARQFVRAASSCENAPVSRSPDTRYQRELLTVERDGAWVVPLNVAATLTAYDDVVPAWLLG